MSTAARLVPLRRRLRGAEPRVWARVAPLLHGWRTPIELAELVSDGGEALSPIQISRALRRRAAAGEVQRRELHDGRRGRPWFAYRLATGAR